MIQRIQSIFLFLVAVAMGIVVAFPIWKQVDNATSQEHVLNAWAIELYSAGDSQLLSFTPHVYLGLVAILAAILAVFSLFQYKNRGKQMMINMINSLVMAIMLGATVYITYKINSSLAAQTNGDYLIGFWGIFGGMICNLLANRFIRKDELLVRSVDRLR
jgi:glucan phosphoethanolaminetransferase (alkaline phosphatase superfamily)